MAVSFSIQDLVFKDYTPGVKHLWKLSFPNVLGTSIPAFLVRSAARPSWTYSEFMVEYMAGKRFFAGKAEYEPITVTLIEPIDSTAAKALLTWCLAIYEPISGVKTWPVMYKRNLTLELLDGTKFVYQKWTLVGAWPQSVNGGDLDYTSTDPVEWSITFRYDYPVLSS